MAGRSSLEENTIFYNAGFKSYDITKCKSGAETWYEWFECSRNVMKKGQVSLEVASVGIY